MPTKRTQTKTPSTKKTATTKAEAKPSVPKRNVLGFKMLRNVLLPGLEPWMKTGLPPMPPMKIAQLGTLDSREMDPKTMMMQPKRFDILVNTFDLHNHEFWIELPQTTPRYILREKTHSDRWYDALVEEECRRTIKSRESAEKLLRILRPLVDGEPEVRDESGRVVGGSKPILKITSDESGFMSSCYLTDEQYDELRKEEAERTAEMLGKLGTSK